MRIPGVKGVILALCLVFGLESAASAASRRQVAAPSTRRPPPDPVAELQNNDAAFALLIEAFRELQAVMIEADYYQRLGAAEKLTDPAARAAAIAQVEENAERRLDKLVNDVNNMQLAYDSARKQHEAEMGRTVPSEMNASAAAERLRGFSIFRPDPDQEQVDLSRIFPAYLKRP
jgi:hypothetical protein